MSEITLKMLIDSGVHFGHITPKKNPKMKKFLLKENNGINLIDPKITFNQVQKTYDYVKEIGLGGGKLLFVGTKQTISELVKNKALKSENFYINVRWLGGTLTNFQTVKQSISKLNYIEKLAGNDFSYPGILKKEAGVYEKSRQKLLNVLAGIRNMRKMPAAVIVTDTNYDKIAIKECNVLNIPIIGITDSNSDPLNLDYVIPANDDSLATVELILDILAVGYLVGKKQFVSAQNASADKLKKLTKPVKSSFEEEDEDVSDEDNESFEEDIDESEETIEEIDNDYDDSGLDKEINEDDL